MRSIHEDFLEYIQQRVRVDFDNRRQQPICFSFAGKEMQVQEIVGRFGTTEDDPHNGFLVEVDGKGVFYLYYQLQAMERRQVVEPGFWILGFRILDDRELMTWCREEREMLVNMPLREVADFHGHICPDLVLGSKFCEYARLLLGERQPVGSNLTVIAENATAALDAIQVQLGATVGNQRLLVMDVGKHNYRLFTSSLDRGWKLRYRPLSHRDEDRFNALERKVQAAQATLDDVVQLQQLMDARIRRLLDLTPDSLFNCEEIPVDGMPAAISGIYRECCRCKEPVLASRAIDFQNQLYCQPCFQKANPGCRQSGLQ